MNWLGEMQRRRRELGAYATIPDPRSTLVETPAGARMSRKERRRARRAARGEARDVRRAARDEPDEPGKIPWGLVAVAGAAYLLLK